MASWKEFAEEAPELAEAVRERFTVGTHCTLATLRRDGSPRISGTEVAISGGVVRLGSMPGSRKAQDLQRDSRFALHSPTADPAEDSPEQWPGEAKLAGRAVDESRGEGSLEFRLDLTEVVFTRVAPGGQALEITSWHEGRGVQVQRRS